MTGSALGCRCHNHILVCHRALHSIFTVQNSIIVRTFVRHSWTMAQRKTSHNFWSTKQQIKKEILNWQQQSSNKVINRQSSAFQLSVVSNEWLFQSFSPIRFFIGSNVCASLSTKVNQKEQTLLMCFPMHYATCMSTIYLLDVLTVLFVLCWFMCTPEAVLCFTWNNHFNRMCNRHLFCIVSNSILAPTPLFHAS